MKKPSAMKKPRVGRGKAQTKASNATIKVMMEKLDEMRTTQKVMVEKMNELSRKFDEMEATLGYIYGDVWVLMEKTDFIYNCLIHSDAWKHKVQATTLMRPPDPHAPTNQIPVTPPNPELLKASEFVGAVKLAMTPQICQGCNAWFHHVAESRFCRDCHQQNLAAAQRSLTSSHLKGRWSWGSAPPKTWAPVIAQPRRTPSWTPSSATTPQGASKDEI